jgi:peptidoglycan/LPS O-acetylase OafA/YrhL
MSAPYYRPDIDGLRAVAVLAVIGFHAFPQWAPGGFAGVDIFFVISGYLISTIILTAVNAGRFSFATFYARRIKRIFPALIAVLAACYAAGWFLLYAGQFEQLGKHIAGGAGFVSNYVLWRESGYFDADADTKPLLHLWSLGIEEQFYLAWPLMVFVAWKARLNLVALTIVVFVLSIYFNVDGIRRDLVGTFYSPFTRFWELTAGSALAAILVDQGTWLSIRFRRLHDRLRSRESVRDFVAVAGLALAMGAVFGLDRTRHYPGLWALIPVVGTVVMIAAGPDAWLNRTVLSQRVLVGIGLISYPLYLWHWPLLSFARLLTGETPPPGTRAVAIAAAFALAWLTYKVIETPIRFGPPRRWVVAALCVLMAVSGAAGYYTFIHRGLPERPLNRTDKASFLGFYESLRRGIDEPYRLECDFMELGSDGVKDRIPEACTARGQSRTLFLWGDSYAQALSAGIREALPQRAALAQVATSHCRPGIVPLDLDVPGGRCKRANDYALARIADLKPELVILAQRSAHDATDWTALATHLRGLGAQDVLLVGPAPEWSPSLPEIVVSRYWGRNYDRVGYGLAADRIVMDRALKSRYAGSALLKYVSLIDALCGQATPTKWLPPQDDCTAVIPGSSPPELMTFDAGHFTPNASRYLARTVLAPYLVAR